MAGRLSGAIHVYRAAGPLERVAEAMDDDHPLPRALDPPEADAYANGEADMILCLTGEGPLSSAVRARLQQQGEEVRAANVSDEDLFGTACGCRAIVYLPAPNLLEGRLHPAPAADRMRKVLGATSAPGVELLVVAAPAGYDAEEAALRKYGVPYVVLRASPLIEELAAQAALDKPCSVWLPRGRRVAVGTAPEVAGAIANALKDDSVQGATIEAPAEVVDTTEALRRAATHGTTRTRTSRVSVHSVPPAVDSLVRRVGRVFRIPEPPIVALHDRLAGV